MPAAYTHLNVPEAAATADGRLPERTREESHRFTYALWEMSRLYAYQGCRVIVMLIRGAQHAAAAERRGRGGGGAARVGRADERPRQRVRGQD